jgi:CO dehydrogenase maturation factor
LLKYSIGVLTEDYDVVIIDGEAGPEQINRRVLSKIDELLVVSDMSARSLETAAGIIQVAKSNENEIRIKNAALLLNRVRDDEPDDERLKKTGAEVIGWFPEDSVLNKFDREGKSLLELPDDCVCVQAACKLLSKLFPDFLA